jgi:hypothetical protein
MGNGDQAILNLLIAVVFGAICAGIASSKGRNAVGWFFIGFFFSCIGLIIILCLSNLKEEQARWNSQDVEQRRLREQLRQEQLKNEAYRKHTAARLDAHDERLGMNTRQTEPVALPAARPAILPGSPPPGLPAENWYIHEEGEQRGPYSFALLQRRARQGSIDPNTMVWVDGMPTWQPANSVPNLFSA